MAHIVVVGAGIGGMPAAYELRELLPKEHQVTVVNPVPFFQFVPSNPWVAVGWRKRETVTLPIAPYLEKKGIAFIPSAVTAIDAKANRLTLADGSALAYDYLVITTGPRLSFDEVPGAGPEGGHTHSVCTVAHAERFHQEYEQFLLAPGPIVVGAMPGASCFGPAYEFAFILDADLRRRKLRHKVPITFVTSEPYIGHLGLGAIPRIFIGKSTVDPKAARPKAGASRAKARVDVLAKHPEVAQVLTGFAASPSTAPATPEAPAATEAFASRGGQAA